MFMGLLSFEGLSQGTCATAVNLGTPSSTSSCTTISSSTGSGNTVGCSGSGFGGGGTLYWVSFCTNSNNDCIVLDIATSTTSNVEIAVYSNCSGSYVSGSIACSNSGTGMTWTSVSPDGLSMVTTANTCYRARIWVKNGGSLSVCSYTSDPPNDECSGATGISGTTTADDNYCMTEAATDPAPAQWCAGTLENTAWYTFTAAADGSATVTINGITCTGGGAGFQIGYWTGSCGSLTNIGCASGSGGTVTATISGLTAGQVVYIGIDGNAGANCFYGISVNNSVPLPVELTIFEGEKLNDRLNALRWITLSEKNNDYFIVEHSLDGKTWNEVSHVEGEGNSSTPIEYSVVHLFTPERINYYRLKQVDFDGKSETFDVISIDNRTNVKLVKTVNLLGQEVDKDFKGIVIEIYSDGSRVKRYNK